MLRSTPLRLSPRLEHHLPRGGFRVGMGEAPLLNRCFVGRIVFDDSTHAWRAPNGQSGTNPVCLDASKTKSKLKTKAKFGLGKGPFD